MSSVPDDQIFMQKLLDMAREAEPGSEGMMVSGVRGLIFVTKTVNGALEHAESLEQVKSRRLRKILAAFHEATEQGEKAALNLQTALSISLAEWGKLRSTLDHIKIQSSSGSLSLWSNWFRKADAKKALQEVLSLDMSKLELPSSSLIEDINEAMAAYDRVRSLCIQQRKQRFEKQATAVMIQAACIASVFVLHLVRAGLVVGEKAAAMATSGASSALGSGIARTTADGLLKKLIDMFEDKINAYNREQEAMKKAEAEAGKLRVDIKMIQIRVKALQAELHCISLQVGVSQRLKDLAGLLEEQVHAEIVKQEGSLLELKSSCGDLIRSILDAHTAFKRHNINVF